MPEIKPISIYRDQFRAIEIFDSCYPDKKYKDGFLDELRAVRKKSMIGLGCYENDKLMALCIFEQCRWEPATWGVSNILVDPTQQGTGYGKLLMSYVENYVLAKNGDMLIGSTLIPEYYERLGYKRLDTGRKEWIIMSKKLNDKW